MVFIWGAGGKKLFLRVTKWTFYPGQRRNEDTGFRLIMKLYTEEPPSEEHREAEQSFRHQVGETEKLRGQLVSLKTMQLLGFRYDLVKRPGSRGLPLRPTEAKVAGLVLKSEIVQQTSSKDSGVTHHHPQQLRMLPPTDKPVLSAEKWRSPGVSSDFPETSTETHANFSSYQNKC